MMRSLLTLILVGFLSALPLAALAEAMGPPRLTVEGRGEVAVVPDMAHLSLSILREAPTAAQALAALSEASAAVLDAASAEGIAARDVQTGSISLDPQWTRAEDGRAPTVAGYVPRNGLILRLRDLDRLGPVLDALVGDGANGFGGLRLGVAEPRVAEDRARSEAVTDALAKAEVLADAAGLRVGTVLSIREGGAPASGPVMMEMAAARSMPVAAGEMTLSVDVTLVLELVAP